VKRDAFKLQFSLAPLDQIYSTSCPQTVKPFVKDGNRQLSSTDVTVNVYIKVLNYSKMGYDKLFDKAKSNKFKFRYLVKEPQEYIKPNIKINCNADIKEKIELPFYGPITEILWMIQHNGYKQNANTFVYNGSNGVDTISEYEFKRDKHKTWLPCRTAKHARLLNAAQHHKGRISYKSIYVEAFCDDPENHTDVTSFIWPGPHKYYLSLKYQPQLPPSTLYVYAHAWQIFEFNFDDNKNTLLAQQLLD
jgi:hypothetical protein